MKKLRVYCHKHIILSLPCVTTITAPIWALLLRESPIATSNHQAYLHIQMFNLLHLFLSGSLCNCFWYQLHIHVGYTVRREGNNTSTSRRSFRRSIEHECLKRHGRLSNNGNHQSPWNVLPNCWNIIFTMHLYSKKYYLEWEWNIIRLRKKNRSTIGFT